METICAICGWHTPCHSNGQEHVCIDVEMCRQNVRINDLIRERNTVVEKNVELLRLLRDHHQWIDSAMRVLQPLQAGWMSPPTFETAARMLASGKVASPWQQLFAERTEERDTALTALSLSVEIVQMLLKHNHGTPLDDALRARILEASEAAAVALRPWRGEDTETEDSRRASDAS